MKMQDRPNILILMADEFRGDCLGYAGHPDVKTPYLDSLAQGGVYFPNAYSSCPTCVPARAVFHTGLTPEHCGRVGYQDGVPWNYGRTIGSELTKLGYQTINVGKMHVAPLRNNLGFESVELCDGYMHYWRRPETPYHEDQRIADDYYWWLKNEKGIAADVSDTGLDCNAWPARPWIYDEMSHPTNWVTTRSLDFLRRRDRRRPFLLCASYVRPHAPYDAPQRYFDIYGSKRLSPPHYGDWDDERITREEGRTFNSSAAPADPELVTQMREGYYACISHLDHQIGRIIIELIEQRLYDDTVIIFVSDHGEMLGDHRMVRKSLPYEGSARIPLIVSGGRRFIGGPRTDDRVAGLEDILPTLLTLSGGDPSGLDGLDLLGGGKREYLHGEHVFEWRRMSNHYIVTGRDKYIWFAETGREQYFDLSSDRYETHEASADAPGRVAELREILKKELSGRPEGFVEDGKLVPRPGKLHAMLDNAADSCC